MRTPHFPALGKAPSRGVSTRLAALCVVCTTLMWLGVQASRAPVAYAEPGFTAPLPPRGSWGVTVWGGGTLDALQAAARANGCTVSSLWVSAPAGGFVRYVPAAPAYVNAEWDATIGATIAAGTPLIVACDTPTAAISVFANARVVSYYGYPDAPTLGALGTGTPEQVADAITERAREYDALPDGRTAIPAFHLIVALAHPVPGPDGTYLSHLDATVIEQYVSVARARSMLLFLDVQVGWADPLAEVQRLRAWLELPFVHVALDPEYATRPKGDPPGEAIGQIGPADVDRVQAYLATVVREQQLPPKVLVLHEFREDMLPNPGYADHPEVEVLIDMDGFGTPAAKIYKYRLFAGSAYAERAGIKLFFHWDQPLITPADVLALDPHPDLIIYQ